jgi:hypothetical protein
LVLTYSKEKFFFGNTFLVSIGIISYSLYLWHYMIIGFGAILGCDIRSFWSGLTIIIASIILAFLTYRFVEFYTRSIESYKFAITLFFAMIMIALICQYIYIKDGLPGRPQLKSAIYSNFFQEPLLVDEKGLALVSKVSKYTSPGNPEFVRSTSDDISKRYVLIIGDSHSQMAYPGLALYLKKYGYETILLGNPGCFPSVNNPAVDSKGTLIRCKETINTMRKLIENKDIHILKVIFITRGPYYMYGKGFGEAGKYSETHFESFYKNSANYDPEREFIKALNSTFKYFNERGIKLYYVIDNPELGFSVQKTCLPRPFNICPQNNHPQKNNCRITLESYLKRASEYRNIVYSLAKNYKNVVILDPINIFCDEKYCYAKKNGKFLYKDDNHLSLDGSFELAKFLIDKIVNDPISH